MSNNSLLNNGLTQPLFIDGERPSATKFNSLFAYLNLNILLVSSAIGNSRGKTEIKYSEPLYRSLQQTQIDLNILSLSDAIGPLSSLNPRSYENLLNPDNFVTEDIDSGISQHKLKYEVKDSISIDDYNIVTDISNLDSANKYFYDFNTNSIIFKQNTSNQLSVTYKTKDSFRKFSYLGSGFNVVPHPYQLDDTNNKLRITATAIPNQYTIALPKVTRNQSNNIITNSETNVLNETNSLFEYQIEIPKFIWDTYNPQVYLKNIPSNVISLKCLDTGEVFDKASYKIIDIKTIQVSNLSISASCLADMKFVLLFSGASNITMNVDDLHKKMGGHTHDGSYGEERIDIKNIAGIFYTQHNDYKYYPSNNIPLNHMPQYLHRNGWAHNSDSINNDNAMNGPLVLLEKLIFGRPTGVTIDKPYIELITNTLTLNNNNKSLTFNYINNFTIYAESLYLYITNSFNIFTDRLGLISNDIQIGNASKNPAEAVKLKYNNSLEEIYSATLSVTKYDKVDGNSASPTNGIPSNPVELSDTFQKVKEEKIAFNDGGKTATSVLRNIYKNNTPNNTANYIIESKNNLPDFIVNSKIRSGKLSAETTKTIILNCIPTRTASRIPDGTNQALPEYLIAQGELTDKGNDGFWDLEFPGPDGVADSVNSCPFLYNLSAMNIQSVLRFNNKLRERLQSKTIPWNNEGNKYPLIAKLGQTYFALVKREKFLTDDAATYFNAEEEAVRDANYVYNRGVNQIIKLLDTTKEGSRNHLETKFYLPNNDEYPQVYGNASDEYETRKASEKYDCFYESDLTYMPIKWKEEFPNPDLDDLNYYNSLTIDDIDSSTELRLIELRELETLTHPYSLGSGNNGFFLPNLSNRYLFEAFDETGGVPTWLTGKLFPMRHTSTSWFRESFPLVRITNSKTNIINIDHGHNVDIINRFYNVNFPKQTDALLYNKTWSLGGAMKGALGHLLFRTQMITAMVDVDHVYLSNDTEYKYEININSKISPLHYSDDEDGVYNIGSYFDQPTVGLGTDQTMSFDGDSSMWPDLGGSLRGGEEGRIYNNYTGLIKRSYDYFYDQRNQSSSTATYRNYKFEEDDFTVGKGDSNLRAENLNRAKPIYEGPCVKLIVRDVDHYVLKAIPCQMAHDSENNLEVLNTTPQTYRLGFKDATHIKRDAADNSTKEFNGVFFYNYSSCGFFHERFVPTNTATSNLAVMTNSDALVNLQSTTEHKLNVTNQAPLTATRRIPSYACLNNSRDIAQHTSFSWDDIVITNTSDLQIKVTVKEEFVPYYQSVSQQTGVLNESIYAPQTINNDGESTDYIIDKHLETLTSTSASKNPLSANILPQGYKKVKVAYIETNNQLYYKCNDHRFMAKNDGTANESIPPNVNPVYANNTVEDRHKTKDLYGQNKFGMRNAYLGPDDRPLEAFRADWVEWIGRALRRSRF